MLYKKMKKNLMLLPFLIRERLIQSQVKVRMRNSQKKPLAFQQWWLKA